eukprot:gnl/TRDRNA2_/TRDRNA2_81723_c0_seq1.p1 gnl/TRDRNA2_/TRDRNA2_81723_c0~~gnl/TRDRNA2_/TRDRNA2_81723_c0_seq1.p1  ORF type:complete len:341 (+),score=52.89 gnl/TRDRNA2_/TRDRNA2_81723_c0_seq1:161-1183(+)
MKRIYLVVFFAVLCNVLVGVLIWRHPRQQTFLSNMVFAAIDRRQPWKATTSPGVVKSHRRGAVPKEPMDACSAMLPFRGTMKSRNKARAVLSLAAALRGVPGDIVEAGVAEGGGSLPLLFYLACTGDMKDRQMHLFDTWEGLPPSKAWQDQGFEPQMFNKSYDSFLKNAKFFQDSYDEMWLQRAEKGLPQGAIAWADAWSRVRIHKGLFKDTMPDALKSCRLSLLMCDGDMYESSIDCLGGAARSVIKGGWVYNDDYYEFLGNYRAVVDFRQQPGTSSIEESSILLVPSRGEFRFIEENSGACLPPRDNELMRGSAPEKQKPYGGTCGGRPCEAGVWQRL